jgi:YebC/PmpR family DNA-binding regulatory protein
MAIQHAKDNNVPGDTIERALNRGTGEGEGQDQMSRVMYEGYGPSGTAIMLETLTDNRNRTVSDIRHTLSKAGGNLAEAGAVAWQFVHRGIIVVEADEGQAEDLALIAIDAGADDFETFDSFLYVYSAPESLEEIRRTIAEQNAAINSSEISMVPTNTISLDNKEALNTLRLLNRLEELDDVQRVFSNAHFPDDVLERYRAED